MSIEETLVILDDEDRTLVEPRLLAEFAGRHRMREEPQLRPRDLRNRPAIAAALFITIFVAAFLVTAVLYQHRELASLRRVVRGLEAEAPEAPAREAAADSPPTHGRASNIAREQMPDRKLAERHAATLLLTKRYRRALPEYRMLARRFPHHSVYRDFVRVLETKVGCSDDEAVQCR